MRCAATGYSLDIVDHWWRGEYRLIKVVVESLKFLHYWRPRNTFPTTAAHLPAADEARRMLRRQ